MLMHRRLFIALILLTGAACGAASSSADMTANDAGLRVVLRHE